MRALRGRGGCKGFCVSASRTTSDLIGQGAVEAKRQPNRLPNRLPNPLPNPLPNRLPTGSRTGNRTGSRTGAKPRPQIGCAQGVHGASSLLGAPLLRPCLLRAAGGGVGAGRGGVGAGKWPSGVRASMRSAWGAHVRSYITQRD